MWSMCMEEKGKTPFLIFRCTRKCDYYERQHSLKIFKIFKEVVFIYSHEGIVRVLIYK